MSLKIHNTLSQTKEIFTPVRPGKVGVYLCGPTVYKPSHIGHAVGPVIFDTVKRYLKFKGFDVTWVVNITDVDDKLIAEAREQHCNVLELAQRVTSGYLDAMSRLGVTGIDHLPRASEHIPEIIAMCERLIAKGSAYVSNGDVYFDVNAAATYGKLSHRRPEDQQSGARDLAGERKRHPGDFALWKATKPDEPPEVQFDSPWGKGRPGWHIECSAMCWKYLGETFDIHGGGMDLIFPHHENEIAQSETCFDMPFAKYWMHNGLTRFNTKKISKSDAEMRQVMKELVLTNLLGKYSPELLRFFILSTHYRRPIEFSAEEMAAKRKGLDTFYRLFERIERVTGQNAYEGGQDLDHACDAAESESARAFLTTCLDYRVRFLEAMDDDFNTGGAVGVLFELTTAVNRYLDAEQCDGKVDSQAAALAGAAVQTIRALGKILGIFEKPPALPQGDGGQMVDDLMKILIDVRAEARKSKQYQLGDMVRDRLAALNVKLEDRPDGTVWRKEDE